MMQVAETRIDQDQAGRLLGEYYRAVRGNEAPNSEYNQVIAGLEAAYEGAALIHLSHSIAQCPRDDQARPRLAIARADRQQVEFQWRPGDRFATFSAAKRRATNSGPTLLRTVDMKGVHGRRHPHNGWGLTVRGYALVPMVPPRALPKTGGRSALPGYYVLWEVEEWSDTPLRPEPPVDPMLLEHIAGDLYRVVSTWDLTELERWVMAARGATA
jgi:hypothetical protein